MATISNANNTAQAESNEPAGQKIPASEVGWCFVHEYYTILNKDPSRLHCFYGQKSTLIHGTEGETVTPSQGEKEIKEKFQSLNLENCRVLITNVDSQASINGGILIQVLGEISNRDEAARKFAQTFFLDVQPNGYYVSNDIIRFLSDDNIEIYNGGEEAGQLYYVSTKLLGAGESGEGNKHGVGDAAQEDPFYHPSRRRLPAAAVRPRGGAPPSCFSGELPIILQQRV